MSRYQKLPPVQKTQEDGISQELFINPSPVTGDPKQGESFSLLSDLRTGMIPDPVFPDLDLSSPPKRNTPAVDRE
jgi:hypothetical protein